ncbi:MAG: beta-glucosidase [Alteromonadaceae bacterium]|nr:beta-glucosidase [Alteromonadaceae bacterium]
MSKPFIWGAAAASYQIEGKTTDDPRGQCVWDMFCNQPGKVRHGDNGNKACQHIINMPQDVELMTSIGLDAYRFSISWPRVLPNGTGTVSNIGLEFYDRLVDELLEHDIAPWATLFHWDYPYELFLKGGWLHPDSSDWFADYAQVIVDRLGDRIKHWMTLNEPQCFIHFGHQTGYHAPGLQLGIQEVLLAAHNCLLAHGKSAQILRNNCKNAVIGAAPVGRISVPEQRTPENIEAARQDTFAIQNRDCWNNTWFADPMFLGKYPEDGLRLHEAYLPRITDADMATIAQPLDFYGVNIYFADTVAMASDGSAHIITPSTGSRYTSMDWLVSSDCLYWASKFLNERYNKPIIITENGLANTDWKNSEGKVEDPQRIIYLQEHIAHLLKAKAEGVDIDGYFCWSIMDNFEWALGYDRRFGLIHVDYETQQRTLKQSAHWYRDHIKKYKGQ